MHGRIKVNGIVRTALLPLVLF